MLKQWDVKMIIINNYFYCAHNTKEMHTLQLSMRLKAEKNLLSSVILILILRTIVIVLSSTMPAICNSSLWVIWTSRSVPGGRQLVGQAANLTFESACIGRTFAHRHVLLLNHKTDTHLPSLGGWKTESTYTLQSVCSPCTCVTHH